MSGFAILVAPGSPPEEIEADFMHLLRQTADFKQLTTPPTRAAGKFCLAAKFDSPAATHLGIVRDDQTGSWLLGAGTIAALEGDDLPDALLVRLLRDYIHHGPKALEAYDGQFALVVYNGRKESLDVVSDTIGLFGIFYCQHGNRLLISSSALAVAAQTQSPPDILAVEHFLRVGRLDADKTLWQDVKRLLGGTVLRAVDGKVEKIEYWSPTFNPSIAQLPLGEAVNQSMQLLTDAFSRNLGQEQKTWVDLTGGFDSRLAAMLVAKIDVPFTAYCVGPDDNPDVQISRKVSETMGWEYVHSQLPEQWEQGQLGWFDQALGRGDGRTSLLRLATTLRDFTERNAVVKTNVMGVGGENFRGYRWQVEGLNIGKTSKVNVEAWLDNILATAIPLRVMKIDRTNEVRRELYCFISRLCLEYSTLPNVVQIDRFELGRDSGLGGAYLSSVAGIGRSLVPFFFKSVVNFAFSLNYQWKYPHHNLFARTLFERENKPLAGVATTTGGPAVPIRVTNAHRFWPLWQKLSNRLVATGSSKILRKTITLWPQPHYSEYPLPTWQMAFYSYARLKGVLNYKTMCTAGLYKENEFNGYLEQVGQNSSAHSEFLDRVITVEMTLRATGTSID